MEGAISSYPLMCRWVGDCTWGSNGKYLCYVIELEVSVFLICMHVIVAVLYPLSDSASGV